MYQDCLKLDLHKETSDEWEHVEVDQHVGEHWVLSQAALHDVEGHGEGKGEGPRTD